ncbi:MAG: discoidin domain-containing protein, partial [Kiritimatiellaeota bacterium]|nr:discoidin domain-containing protein [Kiritimatiellota bacterium]
CLLAAFAVRVVDTERGEFQHGHVPPPVAVRAAGGVAPVAAAQKDTFGLENLALRQGAVAFASSELPGHAIHKTAHLNDGKLGNEHSWIAATQAPAWAGIDLGGAFHVCRVALGSDSSGQHRDRAPTAFSVQAALEADAWETVYTYTGSPVHTRTVFTFSPVRARYVRVVIKATSGSEPRIDELEIFGASEPLSAEQVGAVTPSTLDRARMDDQIKLAILGEEHAWLKMAGHADVEYGLRHTPYPERRHPAHQPDDVLPLPTLAEAPQGEGWEQASRGTVRVVKIGAWEQGPLHVQHVEAAIHDGHLHVAVDAPEFLSAHLSQVGTCDLSARGFIVRAEEGLLWQPVAPQGEAVPLQGSLNAAGTRFEARLPLAWFPGFAEKGLYATAGIGGRWTPAAGRPVNFFPAPFSLRAVPSQGKHAVRVATTGNGGGITVVTDADENTREELRSMRWPHAVTTQWWPRPVAIGWQSAVTATDSGGNVYRMTLLDYQPARKALALYADMVTRKGADTEQVKAFNRRILGAPANDRALLLDICRAKRDLFLRDEGLAGATQLLFSKRNPFRPSHNYSVQLDAPWSPGGGVCALEVPFEGGSLRPEKAQARVLFDSGRDGVTRDPSASFDGKTVYYAHRENFKDYYRIYAQDVATGARRRVSPEGPFHDFWPTPLPDGGIAMISTRILKRYICWRPQAALLMRMEADGSGITTLSHANLTEFAPSVMDDGRILWTRSEYNDKGSDYGHMLWTIRADGTYPELAYGNTLALPQGFANARQMPATREWCAVMISHFGDLNGPVALMDAARSPHDPAAITCLTPEVPWPGFPAYSETFREPLPVTQDIILVSWAPQDRFGLFLIDRHGNRELLHIDPAIDSVCATPLAPRPVPPVRKGTADPALAAAACGQFSVENVYKGLEGRVPEGAARWLRIVEELPSPLDQLPDGSYRDDYDPFFHWYAAPVDICSGAFGWPSYIAKGVLGIVPVEADGSANFTVPSGKVVYFQLLDENLNELQRMRSVLQLQPGEARSCIGCHESRLLTPTQAYLNADAMKKPPAAPQPPPWGAGPFWFERVIQPVLDKQCVSCHNTEKPNRCNLENTRDAESVPTAYRSLISSGTVHYFDYGWQAGVPYKAEAGTFGTLHSRLWKTLADANHADVALTPDERHVLKCWTDLNVPLWGDYAPRPSRKSEHRPQDTARWKP